VTAKQRGEVERRLAEAEARRGEPWEQRLDGAKQALADADRELALFASEHVDALVEDAEAEPFVAHLNSLAVELSDTIAQCHHASDAITQTLALAGIRAQPGAVTRMQTEELARALDAFTLRTISRVHQPDYWELRRAVIVRRPLRHVDVRSA
jgi:hypothetical protein